MDNPQAEGLSRPNCLDFTTIRQHESVNPKGQKFGEFPHYGLLTYLWPLFYFFFLFIGNSGPEKTF